MYRVGNGVNPWQVYCRFVLAVVTLLGAASCVASASKRVETVTPVIVNSAMETLSSEQNQQHLRELIDVVDVEKNSKVVAQQAVAGAVTALSDPEVAAQLHQFSATLVADVMRAMARSVSTDLGPMLRAEVQASVDGLLGTETREQLNTASAEAVLAMSAAFADGIESEIVPAASRAISKNIAPQLRASIEAELMPALALSSRLMAREAMLGVNDALQGELGITLQRTYDHAIARLEGNLDEGRSDAESFFAAVAILLAVGLLVVVVLWRRKVSSAAGSEEAIALLSAALKRDREIHSIQDVLDAIQGLDSAEQVTGYRYLAEHLDRQGEHKGSDG